MALKSGKSSFKNLGTLEFFIALIKTTSSGTLGLALFNCPAIVRTDLTALMPKS